MALTPTRSETKATWASTNPILGTNEVGLESDTGVIKVGDGYQPRRHRRLGWQRSPSSRSQSRYAGHRHRRPRHERRRSVPFNRDAINALSANAVYSLAATKTAQFYCAVAGIWHTILSA